MTLTSSSVVTVKPSKDSSPVFGVVSYLKASSLQDQKRRAVAAIIVRILFMAYLLSSISPRSTSSVVLSRVIVIVVLPILLASNLIVWQVASARGVL